MIDMQNEIDDEVAIAVGIALAEKFRNTGYAVKGEKKSWSRACDAKMPITWERVVGWKKTSRHEGIKGRKSW